MNTNETRTLWISVFAALFAVLLLYSYTGERAAELTKKFGAKQTVVVASKDINEMETIDATKLTTIEVPIEYTQPDSIKEIDEIVGRVALAPIKEKEQILSNKVMEPSPITGLALQVAPSKRAVTLPIDETRGVAKLLKPGDRIDLVAALDVGKGPAQHREVKTIMQDVIVLATGLKIVNELPRLLETVGKEDFIKNIRSDTSFSNITVEVTPEEAQNLIYILATSPGSLFMTLRHPSDREKKSLPQATVETVLNKVEGSTLMDQVRVPSSIPQIPVTPYVAPVTKPAVPKKKKGPFSDL